jgi:hypothetical protein
VLAGLVQSAQQVAAVPAAAAAGSVCYSSCREDCFQGQLKLDCLESDMLELHAFHEQQKQHHTAPVESPVFVRPNPAPLSLEGFIRDPEQLRCKGTAYQLLSCREVRCRTLGV